MRDGNEALGILAHQKSYVILLDIRMFKVDGYATLEFIKSNEELKHIKVAFLTAKNKVVDIEKGLGLVADKYCINPFSIKKIVLEIFELID